MAVYVIQMGDGDRFKIGYAADPRQRLGELQTGNPEELRIVAVMDGGEAEEAALHERFAAHRIHLEWFWRSPELDALIAAHSYTAEAGRYRRISVPPLPEHPSLIERVLHRIQSYAAMRGWSKSRMAAEAALPDTTLRHFYSSRWCPTANILRRLEAVIPDDYEAA